MVSRTCRAIAAGGGQCRAAPLRESDWCLWHSPDHAAEVTEGRRLGGLRRRREVAISGAYDFDGLESVTHIRRLIEVAALETLGLENSLSRSRTLVYIAQVALKALEVGELEDRLAAVEATLRPRIDTARRR